MPITIEPKRLGQILLATAAALHVAANGVAAYEAHRVRVTLDAAIHSPTTTPAQKHAACRAGVLQDVADEQPGDVKVSVAPCPNADDGQCVSGLPASVAASKCAKGKL